MFNKKQNALCICALLNIYFEDQMFINNCISLAD